MKLAKYVDYGTRIISMTVPIRANHAMVKNRLTMMLQMTSLGGVLPSFELQSRVDIIDYEWVFSVLYMNGFLVLFLIFNPKPNPDPNPTPTPSPNPNPNPNRNL